LPEQRNLGTLAPHFSEEDIMTLKSRKVFSAFHMSIIVLSLVSSPLAQTPRELPGIRQAAAQEPQRTEEEKKAAKELERKALALIDEMVAEAMSLRSAEDRVYFLTVASDVLWARDETRARALVREAMDQAVAHMREAKEKAALEDERRFDPRDSSPYGPSYLRNMVLDMVAGRDAKLALELLQLTRPLSPAEQQERGQELYLASQIAESDPQTALRIAEKYLDGNLDYAVIDFWSALLRKDPKVASKLTERIIGALKSEDLLANYEASNFVRRILGALRPRANEVANTQNNLDAANAARLDLAETQQVYRDVLEIAVAAALKVTSSQAKDFQEGELARSLVMDVKRSLPDIEKHLPSRAPAVRAKLAQFDDVFYLPPAPQKTPRLEIENMMENKSPDELIAMAAKSQDEFKDMFYREAAVKLIEQGDTARARQVMKDFAPDDWSLEPLFAGIDRKEREQAMKEGKLEEARKIVSRLRWSEERALAWIELATKAEADKDQKSQRESLKEAGELLGDQMKTQSQVVAQLALAAASLNLAPDRGFEILGSAIDRLNMVWNAKMTITEFNQRRLTAAGVGAAIEEMGGAINLGEFAKDTTALDQHLLAFARKDFDGTVASLKRWQDAEGRLEICLRLLDKILGAEPHNNAHRRLWFPSR
jgi:hypothetical protein